jgi:SAM-dependent MidA family methyltransferase
MDDALYGADGFYTRGGGAGRRRDFITSPEVGPLFGAVLARALDRWWNELGRPSPFMVAECGAGPGTLCRDILLAQPDCASELRYVLIDAAEPMRALHRMHRLPLVEPSELLGEVSTSQDGYHIVVRGQGPLVASMSSLPDEPLHVVLANELLDNLPFDIAQRADDSWDEVRVGTDGDDGFRPLRVKLDAGRTAVLDQLAPHAVDGQTVPFQQGAASWIASARAALARGGRVVVIDYGAPLAELASRNGAWLRTYRGHERGIDPFVFAGRCDITADVATDLVSRGQVASHVMTQGDFLAEHGIAELVDQARALWTERAATGDLAALAARSRIGEADALLDPAGLGAFVVIEWRAA